MMPIPTLRRVSTTQRTRTRFGSVVYYAPIPPHTPAMILSVLERYSRSMRDERQGQIKPF
jgi:hypothetical protein